MKWFSRSTVILKTLYRYGLADMVLPHIRPAWAKKLFHALPKSHQFVAEPLPVRLRLALESAWPDFCEIGAGFIYAP